MFKIILLLFTSLVVFTNANVQYNDFKLVHLIPTETAHLDLIRNWRENYGFDVWKMPKGLNHTVNVLISPDAFPSFEREFLKAKITFNVVNNNVQNLINSEKNKSGFRNYDPLNVVGRYASYNDIVNYLIRKSNASSSFVTVFSAGRTSEGRNINYVRFKTPTARRSLFIDCGIHAREWITISTCVYIIDRFINEFNSGNQATVQLLSNYEIYIMPVLNPDGYEYSRTVNRMWRKNRRVVNSRSGCVGVDLNRNFGHKWNTAGSSTNPCSDVYAGPSANSESETLALQNVLRSRFGNWDVYLTIHAYGQYLFTPWGYSGSILPTDYNDLVQKGLIATQAISAVSGKSFTVGSSAHLLYAASGGSEDWAKGVANIKYSYCFELRPDSDSRSGFIVPESEILIAGEETYQGVKALFNAVRGF